MRKLLFILAFSFTASVFTGVDARAFTCPDSSGNGFVIQNEEIRNELMKPNAKFRVTVAKSAYCAPTSQQPQNSIVNAPTVTASSPSPSSRSKYEVELKLVARVGAITRVDSSSELPDDKIILQIERSPEQLSSAGYPLTQILAPLCQNSCDDIEFAQADRNGLYNWHPKQDGLVLDSYSRDFVPSLRDEASVNLLPSSLHAPDFNDDSLKRLLDKTSIVYVVGEDQRSLKPFTLMKRVKRLGAKKVIWVVHDLNIRFERADRLFKVPAIDLTIYKKLTSDGFKSYFVGSKSELDSMSPNVFPEVSAGLYQWLFSRPPLAPLDQSYSNEYGYRGYSSFEQGIQLENSLRKQSVIDRSILPESKLKPFIILGTGRDDWRAPYVVKRLIQMGYAHVVLYPGGLDGRSRN